ncbi:MAG TPA: ATP synthase F1 subunit gamma [Vicinamibacteria bacterium]|jgi:F-type H+-transporting ATPase subunit gamma
MPALIDIRRRIRSVKSTQQITKAMKMVSAAKLRRAQEAMFAARPYARKMLQVLNDVAARAQPDAHPLLQERGHDKILLVVVTADKGLCGAFNANIIRTATRFVEERQRRGVAVAAVGRKGRDAMRRRGFEVRSERVGVFQPLRYATARELAKELIEAFISGQADEVYLVYNEFKSVIQQRIVVDRLLPIERHTLAPQQAAIDFIYEPEPAGIFESLLPRHVEVQVWKALLESQAAEHGARMTSMDSASNNAAEMIDGLTLYMNKVRQAAITKEIIEIVSGAGSPA